MFLDLLAGFIFMAGLAYLRIAMDALEEDEEVI